MSFFSELKNSLNLSEENTVNKKMDENSIYDVGNNEEERLEPFSNIFRTSKLQEAKNKLKTTAQSVVSTVVESEKIQAATEKIKESAISATTTAQNLVTTVAESEKTQATVEKVKKGAVSTASAVKEYAKDMGEKVSEGISEKKELYQESKLLEADEIYWGKRATIGQYFYDIQNGFIVPEKVSKDAEERYQIALEAVGNVTFDQLFGDEKDYFAELDDVDLFVGVAIGVSAVLVAMCIDEKGKNIEKKIDEKTIKDNGIKDGEIEVKIKDYDTNNAFDLVSGKGHRKSGHGITSFMEEIPADMKVANQGNRTIAEITGCTGDTVKFSEYFKAVYSYDDLSKYQVLIERIKHVMVHFSKDIFTPDGIPLPFSEMLTKYVKNDSNKSGYSVQNKLLEKLGTGANSVKASDLATPVYIKTLLSIYYKLRGEKDLSENAIKLKKAQLATLAYGTCLIVQSIMWVIAHMFGKPGTNYSGARINYAMAMTLIKNIVQIEVIINKEQKATLKKYDDLIKKLEETKEDFVEVDFEEVEVSGGE
ncbi:MAG: hypothetical protein E7557_03085 [Ruminococcaceae bacterium]|nr:hypothetical protein [Oscillospiraceae bacterium]